MAATQVIIVGGGLAGLSAAHTVLEHGGRVVVIDKSAFMGGNSTKATSGINGTLTRTQVDNGIQDNPKKFEDDTAQSAGHRIQPELVKVLTHESGAAVEWLQDAFGLDLSLISRLGGHSEPRTHRGKERFPGFTITYALMEKIEEIAENSDRARIITKARVNKLLTGPDGSIIGVEYEKDGKTQREMGPVVVATGGYAADFSDNSLLIRHRPDLKALPTTNGDHCTGDGIKFSEAIGAQTVDMDYVQVHPTGLVFPNEPDAKVLFLAAEALRGCGALLLNAEGKRFADELGRRDYVTGEMNNQKGPFRLVLNSKASKEIEWHCKHYVGRGVMLQFPTGAALAKEMGITEKALQETFEKYNAVAKSGKDEFGKKFFHNTPFDVKDQFHVALVTPVVHYCMGGLQISPDAAVLNKQNKPIAGLWATGEVCGGVHGKNRLGGNSLLDCVVFGRVSGVQAARYLLDNAIKALQSGGAQRRLDTFVQQAAPAPAAKAAAPAAVNHSGGRKITKEEVAQHKTEKDCWCIINGKVYDVTKFLPDHPGGKKAILVFGGKDATAEFNMLHKPDVIQKYAPDAYIGELA
jgi:flavocytochrome c